jgi:hypothetical protein
MTMFAEDKYILIGQTPVPCTDLLEWAHWFESGVRRVGETVVGDWRVSTVFLGLDHNYGRILGRSEDQPILFETMIFYLPADKLDRPVLDVESCRKWAEERDALIATLPEKEQEIVDYQERYATWLGAEAGHEVAVKLVEEATGIEREMKREETPLWPRP